MNDLELITSILNNYLKLNEESRKTVLQLLQKNSVKTEPSVIESTFLKKLEDMVAKSQEHNFRKDYNYLSPQSFPPRRP